MTTALEKYSNGTTVYILSFPLSIAIQKLSFVILCRKFVNLNSTYNTFFALVHKRAINCDRAHKSCQ